MPRAHWPLIAASLIAIPVQQARAQADSGSYTVEQAARGQDVFRRICAACHAPIQFTSSGFRDGWNGRTAFELFDQIRTTMPQDNPGRLRREQYADVVAYLFKLNGQPAGSSQLAADSESLRRVQIQFVRDPRSP